MYYLKSEKLFGKGVMVPSNAQSIDGARKKAINLFKAWFKDVSHVALKSEFYSIEIFSDSKSLGELTIMASRVVSFDKGGAAAGIKREQAVYGWVIQTNGRIVTSYDWTVFGNDTMHVYKVNKEGKLIKGTAVRVGDNWQGPKNVLGTRRKSRR